MQKIVGLLEKNVQWLVLALGGAYMLWMIWSYVFTAPVSVDVGGRSLAPGEVDDHVYREKAQLLDEQMRRTVAVPNVTPPDPVQSFMAALENRTNFGTLPPVVFTPPTGKLEVLASAGGDAAAQPNDAGAAKVEKLPAIAAATDLKARRGRSTVAIPDPAGQVEPTLGNLGPVRILDKDWVSVRYLIGKDALAKSFEEAKVPQFFMKTLILRAELVRQEKQPDGSWGSETVLAPLRGSKLQPYPAPSDRVAMAQYNEWARANQQEILQPAFYGVTKGDQWGVPGEELNEATSSVPFDPRNYLDPKSDLSKLTKEQKDQVLAARREAAAEADRQRREQRGQPRQRQPSGGEGGEFGPGGGQRGGGRGPGFQASDPDRPRNYQVPNEGQPRGFQPGGGEFGPSGAEFSPGAPNQQQSPAFNPANFPIPNGDFDPRAVDKDLTGWAHDDSVEPGKIYRYKIRYRVKNPVYQTFNVTSPQALAEQFDLISIDSEWTHDVSVPALTSFFIANNFDADSARSVKFDVFKFQDGVLHTQSFVAAPGDVIGRKDKTVDFNTGWTVVDIRRDLRSSGSYVLLTDSTGRLEQRLYDVDKNDPELKKLRQQAGAQAAAVPGG
jgi:hypothetical protein